MKINWIMQPLSYSENQLSRNWTDGDTVKSRLPIFRISSGKTDLTGTLATFQCPECKGRKRQDATKAVLDTVSSGIKLHKTFGPMTPPQMEHELASNATYSKPGDQPHGLEKVMSQKPMN